MASLLDEDKKRRAACGAYRPAATAFGCCSVCCDLERLAWISLTAALMASSASMLQCSFTGGRLRCLAMSLFLIVSTSSSVLPFTHSVAMLLLAMAEPQPNVLNLDSTMYLHVFVDDLSRN